MKAILLVGIGGFIGATLRYKTGSLILHFASTWKFPAATFLVNVLGCLIAGMLMVGATKHGLFSPETKLFIFTGILGGFTTFSAFGLETITLLQQHEIFWAFLYVLLTIFVGVFALWLGMLVVK